MGEGEGDRTAREDAKGRNPECDRPRGGAPGPARNRAYERTEPPGHASSGTRGSWRSSGPGRGGAGAGDFWRPEDARGQDPAVPLALPRSCRRLPHPVREPSNRQGRLCPGVPEQVCAGRMRPAEGQVRGMSQPGFPSFRRCGRCRSLDGPPRDGPLSTPRGRDLLASRRGISTRAPGPRMSWRSQKSAGKRAYHRRSSAPARGTVCTPGSSSRRRCLREPHGRWAATS